VLIASSSSKSSRSTKRIKATHSRSYPTIAKRLPYSDHIVALDNDGTIAEQGPFDKLNGTGGYVSGFDLALPDWEYTIDNKEYESPPRYSERQVAGKVAEDELQAEANRRTGDVAIYRYYVSSVGWIPTLIFIVSCTIFIFGMSFPCKCATLLRLDHD
jgi:ATP-binding cassette subfamily C (CFTR/MRP) protein 1